MTSDLFAFSAKRTRIINALSIALLLVACLMLYAAQMPRMTFLFDLYYRLIFHTRHRAEPYFQVLRFVVFTAYGVAIWRFILYRRYADIRFTFTLVVVSGAFAWIFRPVAQEYMARTYWQEWDALTTFICAIVAVCLSLVYSGALDEKGLARPGATSAKEAEALAKFNARVAIGMTGFFLVATLVDIGLGIAALVEHKQSNAQKLTAWQQSYAATRASLPADQANMAESSNEYENLVVNGPELEAFNYWPFIIYEGFIVAFAFSGGVTLFCKEAEPPKPVLPA